MRFDESGDWTSLSCYYSLHDRVVRGEAHVAALKADNERLRKAGDALLTCLDYPKAVWPDSVNPRIEAWHAAKGQQP
jgi:hypothetical protein